MASTTMVAEKREPPSPTWDSSAEESVYKDGVSDWQAALDPRKRPRHRQFSARFSQSGVGFYHIFGTVDNLWLQGQEGKDPVTLGASKDAADRAADIAPAEGRRGEEEGGGGEE